VINTQWLAVPQGFSDNSYLDALTCTAHFLILPSHDWTISILRISLFVPIRLL
jgi:hypothetical protein